jgi:ferric-dicitrate binding protein FerR (iron transport regulator)
VSELPVQMEGKETFEKIKTYSAQFQAPEFNETKVFEGIKTERKNQKNNKIPLLLKIAAVLIIVFGSITFFVTLNTTSLKTIYAQSTTIALPDTSEVTLMPGSEVEFNDMTWSMNRKVNLKGEAFFNVAKGKVFTVGTAFGNIEVLGTQFTVKAIDGKLSVVCYEGKVRVTTYGMSEIISANEYLSYKENEHFKKRKIKLGAIPSEVDYYNIVNQELAEVIKDIERYYDVKIEANGLSTEKNFTGKIPKDDLKKALEIVAKTFKLVYKSIGKNSFIFVEDAVN